MLLNNILADGELRASDLDYDSVVLWDVEGTRRRYTIVVNEPKCLVPNHRFNAMCATSRGNAHNTCNINTRVLSFTNKE